jgi:hypothetical protein
LGGGGAFGMGKSLWTILDQVSDEAAQHVGCAYIV